VTAVERYVTRVETKVVVCVEVPSGGERVVGEFVVRAESKRDTAAQAPIRLMTDSAMEKIGKLVNVMGSGVQNCENNRRK
jgi:hypothetical protein